MANRKDRPGILQSIKELILCLFWVLYYWIIAIVKSVVPASIQGKDVSGETVLITGAGSGLGRLMAVKFARLKCRLVLWDINEKGNEETADKCRELGAVAVKSYTINLCDREEIYKTAESVKREVGPIDILVNNAGIVTGQRFLQCPDSMIQKTMEVNIMAHFWTAKAFLPSMIERNHGHIVNIASSAGYIGVTGLADYCASKFAAVGFDEALRFEMQSLGKDGVHTTVVCPYFINTGMFEGAKTRIPWLLPILEPDNVTDRIMDAILCNQHILMLPRILYVFTALKGIVPTTCLQVVSDYVGVNHSMDDFKGRQPNKVE